MVTQDSFDVIIHHKMNDCHHKLHEDIFHAICLPYDYKQYEGIFHAVCKQYEGIFHAICLPYDYKQHEDIFHAICLPYDYKQYEGIFHESVYLMIRNNTKTSYIQSVYQ